jgi:REP element-mobilizing transposase RayT
MPNHVHLLLNLQSTSFNPVETHHDASLTTRYNNYFYHRIAIRSSQTIPLVIKQFKSAATKQINPKTIFFAWQPRYHDIIIKDKEQYSKIKNYIINNPINWEKDKYFTN